MCSPRRSSSRRAPASHRGAALLAAGALAAACLAATAGVGGCVGSGAGTGRSGGVSLADRTHRARPPLAVALVQSRRGSELVTVDLQRFAVVRRTRLRSLCLAIEAAPQARQVVTAQCGGPDRAADRACGVFEADSGAIDYVDLGAPNPAEVAVAGTRALVVHGFEQAGRTRATIVDLTTRTLESARGLAPGIGLPVGLGAVFATVAPVGRNTALVLVRPEQASATTTLAVAPGRTVTALAAAAGGRSRGLLVVSRSSRAGAGATAKSWRAGSWYLERLNEQGAVVSRTVLPGITHGVFSVCRVGDEVALADADGLDLSDPGRRIHLRDAQTLGTTRTLAADGMPAALAAWGDRLLVFDGITAELLEYPPDAQRPARRVRLGGAPLGTGDLVVLD